jgi:hypothetical protein
MCVIIVSAFYSIWGRSLNSEMSVPLAALLCSGFGSRIVDRSIEEFEDLHDMVSGWVLARFWWFGKFGCFRDIPEIEGVDGIRRNICRSVKQEIVSDR